MQMSMKVQKALLFVVVYLLFAPLWAQEGARSGKTYTRSYGSTGTLFDVGIYYGQSESDAEPAAANEWRNTTSIYDVKLGYITSDGFYSGTPPPETRWGPGSDSSWGGVFFCALFISSARPMPITPMAAVIRRIYLIWLTSHRAFILVWGSARERPGLRKTTQSLTSLTGREKKPIRFYRWVF
jgi:hypothetical protein